METKNILHVVHVSFALSFFFGDQLSYMEKKGYNVHLICSSSDYLPIYCKQQGIKYKAIDITRKVTFFKDIMAVLKICKYIKDNKIDTIVGHTIKGAFVSMIAGKIMRVPKRLYFRHGSVYTTCTGLKAKVLVSLDRFIAFCSTKIICVSPSLAKQSLEYKINPESKQVVLGKGTCGGIDTINKFNPVNIEINRLEKLRQELSIPSDAYVIGYCGRLVNDKGIIELLDAFKLLQKKHSSKILYLLLVGPIDPQRDAISSEKVNFIKMNKCIITTGYVKEGIEYYYSLMDVFVFPSYREGFGMSVLEASALEKPVLVSKSVGCIDSIIEGYTGYYIDINPHNIADKIELLFNKSICYKIGKQGRKFVTENFENLIVWKYIEELYV